uniref:Transmembrane protein 65 n=1 Tax=Leptobrachium leishanense TaxID=445787 RepID=A0A8C5N403_9ANUR
MSLLPLLSRTALRPSVSTKPWNWLGLSRARCPGRSALPSCRLLGTHPRKEPMESLNSPQGARDFIYSLHATERSCLLRELHRFESIAIAQGELLIFAFPTPFFFHNALPFVGFGFLDNAIMIIWVQGLSWSYLLYFLFFFSSLAGYVEAISSRLGLPIPDLNPKQADMWQTRVSAHLGKAIGVAIGCILGMFPLLFFSWEEEEKPKAETPKK